MLVQNFIKQSVAVYELSG